MTAYIVIIARPVNMFKEIQEIFEKKASALALADLGGNKQRPPNEKR